MKRIISLFVLCFMIISVFCGCSLIVPQLERLDDDHNSSVVAGEWQVDDIVFDIEGYTAVDDDCCFSYLCQPCQPISEQDTSSSFLI